MRFGEDCYRPAWDDDGKTVYGQGRGFFTSDKYSSTSVLIGMPASPREWMRAEKLRFKDYIMEYVIPANAPTTIFMMNNRDINFGGSRQPQRCTPPATKFTPLPGKDYDAFMEGGDGKCWVEIREIDSRGRDSLAMSARAPTCRPLQEPKPTKTGPDADR